MIFVKELWSLMEIWNPFNQQLKPSTLKFKSYTAPFFLNKSSNGSEKTTLI